MLQLSVYKKIELGYYVSRNIIFQTNKLSQGRKNVETNSVLYPKK